MNANDQKLAHALKVQFGTSDYEPTEAQLTSIKNSILRIKSLGRYAAEGDWRLAVHTYCPSAGTHKYAGLDNSDLNTLLALATQAANG